MGSLFSKLFRDRTTPVEDWSGVYVVSQAAESPSVSGTWFDPAADVNAFALVTENRLDEARQLVRDMPRKDRALLSLSLEELSRLVSEEEDFRRTADRRAARLSLDDVTEGLTDW